MKTVFKEYILYFKGIEHVKMCVFKTLEHNEKIVLFSIMCIFFHEFFLRKAICVFQSLSKVKKKCLNLIYFRLLTTNLTMYYFVTLGYILTTQIYNEFMYKICIGHYSKFLC
jgi:hypothetical protein